MVTVVGILIVLAGESSVVVPKILRDPVRSPCDSTGAADKAYSSACFNVPIRGLAERSYQQPSQLFGELVR